MPFPKFGKKIKKKPFSFMTNDKDKGPIDTSPSKDLKKKKNLK